MTQDTKHLTLPVSSALDLQPETEDSLPVTAGSVAPPRKLQPRTSPYALVGENLEWVRERDDKGKVIRRGIRPATKQEKELVKALILSERHTADIARKYADANQQLERARNDELRRVAEVARQAGDDDGEGS